MNEGWLWLSILKTQASPPPMSITPAFSPGPWITHGAFVGSPRRWMREDLYEQCSFHIAEKMPSSVKLGTLPISFRIRSYSSGLSPWLATSSGVILGSLLCMGPVIRTPEGREKAFYGAFSRCPELCGGAAQEHGFRVAEAADLGAQSCD